jgi:hypothetical protein
MQVRYPVFVVLCSSYHKTVFRFVMLIVVAASFPHAAASHAVSEPAHSELAL